MTLKLGFFIIRDGEEPQKIELYKISEMQESERIEDLKVTINVASRSHPRAYIKDVKEIFDGIKEQKLEATDEEEKNQEFAKVSCLQQGFARMKESGIKFKAGKLPTNPQFATLALKIKFSDFMKTRQDAGDLNQT